MKDIENTDHEIYDKIIELNRNSSAYEYSEDDDSDDDDSQEISIAETWLRHLGSLRRTIRRVLTGKVSLSKRSPSIWVLLILLILALCYISQGTRSSKYDSGDDVGIFGDAGEETNADGDLISKTKISSKIDSPFQIGCRVPAVNEPRANAAFVMLARNSEVEAVVKSMQSMERHFNQWFNYPWVFLNNEPFNENFKRTVKKYTSSKVEFGTIPTDKWNFSEDVDPDEIREHIAGQSDRRIMYGFSESYHKMCRFFSGYFYKHELVKKRDWYWRVEPDVEFYCDLTYDPFIEMEKRNKKYGFTVVIDELYYTIPGLFKETRSFIRNNDIQVGNAWGLFIKDSRYAVGENASKYDGLNSKEDILHAIELNLTLKRFLSMKNKQDLAIAEYNPELMSELFSRSREKPRLYEDRFDLEEYNLCHFWSNFEIARTDLFNSPEYDAYFEHLEASGGFYKERWGDAPVHSLAVGMMLDLDEIHYFRDIGYRHSTLSHCPGNSRRFQVKYEPSETYYQKDLKKDAYWLSPDDHSPNGVGCRCRCPKKTKEIEDSPSACIRFWDEITSDKHQSRNPVDVDYWENEIDSRLTKFLATGGKLGENTIVDALLG